MAKKKVLKYKYFRNENGEHILREKSKIKKSPINAMGSDKGKCNARLKKKDKYCSKSAGWGTNHLRIGRCKLHGGRSTGAKYTPPAISSGIKAFLGSFSSEDKDAFKAFINDKTLEGEIAAAKTKLVHHLHTVKNLNQIKENINVVLDRNQVIECGEDMVDKGIVPKAFIDLILITHDRLDRSIRKSDEATQRYMELISKMGERDQRIREGLKLVIDVRILSEFIAKLTIIVKEELPDHPSRNRIAQRIKEIGLQSIGQPDVKVLKEGKGRLFVDKLVKLDGKYDEVLDEVELGEVLK